MVDLFDRRWWNRLYFKFLSAIHERDPEMAEEIDIEIIGGLGRRMAREALNDMNILIRALRRSHWFQEYIDVAIIDNSIYLTTPRCSWQTGWHKRFGESMPTCVVSHGIWLENFVKEIIPDAKVENLHRPGDLPAMHCRWQITFPV